MKSNILKSSNLSSVYLLYNDGSRKKFKVSLRYIDMNECYFAAETILGFAKPKKNTPAQLVAYTTDGVYTTDVKISDATFSIHQDILFIVNLPTTWNYTQLRRSSRKECSLSFELKFNDGYVIQGNTKDIALGGISFISESPIPEIYKKVPGILYLNLSNKYGFAPLLNEIVTEVKFLRMPKDEYGFDKCHYVYKFLTVQNDGMDAIKYLLVNLNENNS